MSIHACDSENRSPSGTARAIRLVAVGGALAAWTLPLAGIAAEPLDPSLLPSAVSMEIDFSQHVAPILEASCIRCHGEEKAKSSFSLATRERALKGGSEGIDIVPGDSAASPLIHYVTRLVEDMEMPPGGRDEPLTDKQIGILRSWIDQGARWQEQPAFASVGSITPAVRWIGVSGDHGAFRELESQRDGWTGGLEEFSFIGKSGSGSKVEIEGHALAPDDYKLSLTLSKPELGFVHAGAEQWRRYYDDIGGYNALAIPSTYRLDDDLGLDIGKAWLDVGLTLPNAPTIVLGYEYQFRDGDKSTLQWGLADGRAIYPASKEIDERVHILKFDFEYDLSGWTFEDNARVEWYQNKTRRNNTLQESPAPITRVQIDEEGTHIRGANSLRVEKQVTDWWLFSAGHFYSRLSGDSSYNQTTVDGGGAPAFGNFWSAQRIELDSESQVFSLASSFQPFRTMALSVGVQNEHTKQMGFGPINLDFGDPSNPFLFPVSVDSSLNRQRWSEFAALRFDGIPFTMLFADARLDQENGSQFEQETGNLPVPLLLRDTDFSTSRGDWRAGFQFSKWRFVSLNAHYRGQFNNNNYNHLQDLEFGSSEGYSAFIRQRDVHGDGFHASVTLKPITWLRARLKYKHTETRYTVETDPSVFASSPGGQIDSGLSRANHYTLGLTLKPWRRLGLGGSLGYIDSSTSTARNDITSVADYAGYNWWARGTAAYVLTDKDDLFLSYEYWRSDYGQTHFATGLPLGSDYTRHAVQVGIARQWNEHLRSNLRYGYYDYSDAASGGARSYTAHGVFASVSYAWR